MHRPDDNRDTPPPAPGKNASAKRAVKSGMRYVGFSPARKIALGIYHDVCDRRGIKREFEKVDDQITEEILSSWEAIAQVVIDGDV